MIQEEIELINEEIRFVKNIFINLVNILPSFDILNKRILPYGLKPHTRSIAWIVEQVIVQQMKYNSAILCLIYGCFGVHFKNINISFDKNQIHCFSPQFLPIYINPRNDKIQATYRHKTMDRTRTEFLTELKNNSKSIILD